MHRSIDVGEGPRAVVCIHGWCCRPGDFRPQAEALGDRIRLFAPAWLDRLIERGDGAACRAIAEDIAAQVRERGIENPLLCGHSMGGYLATYLAKERLLANRGLLILDSALPLNAIHRSRYLDLARQLETGDYEGVYRDFAQAAYFAAREEGPRADAILAGMLERPPEIAIRLLDEFCGLDFDASLSNLDVPLHLIASESGAFDLPALRARVPGATGERIEGAGHFITLFEPQRVSQAIEARFDGSPGSHR